MCVYARACVVTTDRSTAAVVRSQVALKGGIDAIVAAMRGHAGREGVQEKGCGALGTLASDNAGAAHPLQRRGALAIVGVSAIHHCNTHGVGTELCGGDIPDVLDDSRRDVLVQVLVESLGVLFARVGFAFSDSDLTHLAADQ